MRDALKREQNKMIEWRYNPENPDKVNKYYFSKISGLKIDKKEDKKLFKKYTAMEDDEKFKKFIQGEDDEDSSDSVNNS